MRPLEIALLVVTLAAVVALYVALPSAWRWLRFLPAAALVLAVVQLAADGYRWQMVPAYALAAALFALSLPALLRTGAVPAARSAPALAVAASLVWLVAVALPVVLPVPRLPAPAGPDAVGSVLYDWTDAARPETYSADPNARRELMVQVWYPAQQPAAGAALAPFVDNYDVALPAFANFLGLPPFTLQHLRLVKTHAYQNAPLAASGGPFPVVIYSHGYQSYRTASTAEMEALASAGYIAVSIDHPYAAMFTIYPDGRVVLNDPEMLPPTGRMNPGDQDARERLQGVVVADERFVMDQLALLNAGQLDARFAGQIDLEHIGLTGVSLGGGAITWTCLVDPRCKAGLAQDGWYEPMPAALVKQPLRVPFMFFQSETKMWKVDNLARLDSLYAGAAGPAYHLKLHGVLHDDFGDYPLLTPVSALVPNRGSLNGRQTVQEVNAYIVAFFDRYLKGKPSPLLDGPSATFPQVEFDSHGP